MDILNSLYHLISEHQSSLKGKLSIAFSKKFFQTAAKLVHHHTVSLLVAAKPVHLRDTDSIRQYLVDLLLISQLRLIHWNRLLLSYSSFFVLL